MILAISICCLAYLLVMILKAGLALSYAASEERADPAGLKDETVTIAQAILSGDPGLETMLESNLSSLSGQRFLWLCDDHDEEARRVTARLIASHPGEKITVLLCPPCPPARNPKVFKLIHGSSQVDTPFLLVLDDDTHLPRATAATLIHHARSHDIATGLPQYEPGDNLPSSLLAQFVNNNSAMTYLSLLPFAPPISINGMCYAMKSADRAIFEAIGHHLTDDLALATAIQARGGSIHQSAYPQRIATRVKDLAHYARMTHRWHLFALLLLRKQPPRYRAAIFLLHGWHPLVLWALLACLLAAPSWPATAIVAGFLLVRAALIRIVQRRLFHQTLHLPGVSLLSEMLQPLHLVHAALVKIIDWRGRRYRVFASDHFTDAAHDNA
ncbi:MAG: hopanoid biosynthesis associated glycosyl transferase protein HpnI [Akkermansiaceae bacterium]|nr:hopanoid biosynthesis associated glycosyl transferase protein HpnI [Akkermansiaceae bacterium]